jgi:hypothetical protein
MAGSGGRASLLRRRQEQFNRQCRLLACACARRVLPLMREDVFRQAIEVTERYLDGKARFSSLARVHQAINEWEDEFDLVWGEVEDSAALACGYHHARSPDDEPIWIFITQAVITEARSADRTQTAAIASLVEDVFGPLHARMTAQNQAPLADPKVRDLAAVIYREGDFASLPVLADALEDAGCTEQVILDHCRQGREHVRGCWVVDLVRSVG